MARACKALNNAFQLRYNVSKNQIRLRTLTSHSGSRISRHVITERRSPTVAGWEVYEILDKKNFLREKRARLLCMALLNAQTAIDSNTARHTAGRRFSRNFTIISRRGPSRQTVLIAQSLVSARCLVGHSNTVPTVVPLYPLYCIVHFLVKWV